MGDWTKNTSMALALIMAGATGWAGFHERGSIPEFEKNKPQYLFENRPAAVKAVLREQFEAFQSQYRDHSFETGGPLNVTLDPDAPATQAAADKKLEANFNAEVRNKRIAPFIMEPMALLFLAVAGIPLWEAQRRRNPQPQREIDWSRVPPPPPRNLDV